MASRVKNNFFQVIRNRRNPNNGIHPLLDGNGRTVNNNKENTEMFNKYLFCIREKAK